MKDTDILLGQLVGTETVISLEELCQHCTIKTSEIITMVEEGILDPTVGRPQVAQSTKWQFHISSVRRVKAVIHLQRDLGVNLPGAALALELLDQIAELKAQRG